MVVEEEEEGVEAREEAVQAPCLDCGRRRHDNANGTPGAARTLRCSDAGDAGGAGDETAEGERTRRNDREEQHNPTRARTPRCF